MFGWGSYLEKSVECMELYCNNYIYIDYLKNYNIKKGLKLVNIIDQQLDAGYYYINNNYKISNDNNVENINNIYQQLYHAQINNSYKLIYNINEIGEGYFNTYNSLTSKKYFYNEPNVYLSNNNFLNQEKKQYINKYTLYNHSFNTENKFLLKKNNKNDNLLKLYLNYNKETINKLLNERTIKFIDCLHGKIPSELCIKLLKIEEK